MDGFEGTPEHTATARAVEQGYTVRIASRDGNYFVVTRDYRPHDRVNFDIEDGVVKTAIFG